MKRWMSWLLVLVMMLGTFGTLTACGTKTTVIDYADAESFEAALNAGENLEGKVVRFVAGEFHPDSALGYNVWAGEHLNFVSSRNPDIKEGDIVTVRALTIESAMGSWIINYEKVDNAEIGETTISNPKGSDLNGADINGGAESASDGVAGAAGSSQTDSFGLEFDTDELGLPEADTEDVPKEEEKPLELKDFGWYCDKAYNGMDTAYVDFAGLIYNPNETLVAEFPSLTITVRNGDGSIVATEDQVGSVIMPGDTVTLCGMFSMASNELADAEITFDVDCSEFGNGTSIYGSAKTTDFEITNVSEKKGSDRYITGEIINHFSEEVRSVNLSLLLRKEGKIVYIENTFIDGLKPEKPKAFEFQRYSDYPDYDTIDISAMVW